MTQLWLPLTHSSLDWMNFNEKKSMPRTFSSTAKPSNGQVIYQKRMSICTWISPRGCFTTRKDSCGSDSPTTITQGQHSCCQRSTRKKPFAKPTTVSLEVMMQLSKLTSKLHHCTTGQEFIKTWSCMCKPVSPVSKENGHQLSPHHCHRCLFWNAQTGGSMLI